MRYYHSVKRIHAISSLPAAGQAGTTPRDAPAKTRAAARSSELPPAALVLIDQLKARDNAVRQHEQAHLAAASGLAISGASYTYQRGPNGVNYAVGGEVQIDTSPGRTPQETIARARTVAAAALAPADPSATDRAVAAQALQQEQQALTELALAQSAGAASARVAQAYGQSQDGGTIDTYA